MESFYKQTTVICTELPAAFLQKPNSFQTTVNLHYQIVFRVADEANLIEEKWRLPFYKYFANCVQICGGTMEKINGTADHVDLLIALCSTKALAEFLRELKLLSQTWVRRKMQIPGFTWRDDSEAYAVSAIERERVKANIQRRSVNYRQRSKQERLNRVLRQNRLAAKQLAFPS